MTPRLPQLTARQIIAILQRKGFVRVRQSGSHAIFHHPDLTVIDSNSGERETYGF